MPAPPRPLGVRPLGVRPALVAAALVGAGWLASGCLVSGGAVRPPGAVAPDAAVSAALADSLAAAPSGAARRAVAARALRAGGVTPLAGGLFAYGVGAPLVGGFVPGRTPGRASELVVVAASLDGPAAADVLDAARVLVELSLVRTVPERTVQVVFWSAPLDDRTGPEAALRSPLWPRAAVAAVVAVGDGAAFPDSLAGAPVTAVPADRPALAARVVDAALALAAEPPAVPPAP